MVRRVILALALIAGVIQATPSFGAYGLNILSNETFASGSRSWGYSDNVNCLNGYPNVGESNPNSITTSKISTLNQYNHLDLNDSVYTFTLTVTGNNAHDGIYEVKMFDTSGTNETSTGLLTIPAGSSQEVVLRLYPKSTVGAITLTLTGRSQELIDGCNGPIFTNPQLIETAPPPKLSNTWMSPTLYDLTTNSFNLVTYTLALQPCAVAYSYLIYVVNPAGVRVLYRSVRVEPSEVSDAKKTLISGLTPRTRYDIRQIGHGDLINCLDSDPSDSYSSYTTSGPATLSVPVAPTLTNNSDNSINVSLTEEVSGATDYLFVLYESDSKTTVLSQLVSTGIVGGSATIAGLSYGKIYYGGLVAKANGVDRESSRRSALARISIPAVEPTIFSDSECNLSPSSNLAVVQMSTTSGYCLSRIETNTSIVIPSGVSRMDILAVGGGGGGGAWVGGGGGGGGVNVALNTNVSGTISVQIGAGGRGGTYTSSGVIAGTSGGATTFGSITALGGGFGASSTSFALGAQSQNLTIANGGGGSYGSQSPGGMGKFRTGGSGSSSTTAPFPAGGGAGAGAGGGSASLGSINSGGNRYCNSLGGNGGNGLRDINAISGSSSNYFGGGGGGGIHGYLVDGFYVDYCSGIAGNGGLGGGGDGLTPESNPYGPQTGYSGVPNTGGGGGGVGHSNNNATYGGVGGSGVVYLRWSKLSEGVQSISITAPSSVTTFRSRLTLTAILVGDNARVTFLQNGKRISGCIGLRSTAFVATCSWKASARNGATITAVVNQSNGLSTVRSNPMMISVGRRTGPR